MVTSGQTWAALSPGALGQHAEADAERGRRLEVIRASWPAPTMPTTGPTAGPATGPAAGVAGLATA